MIKRLNYLEINSKATNGLAGANKHIVSIDNRLRAMIELRVSQINGCVFCVDLHANQARAEGETQHLEGGVRVDAFARWPGVIQADSAAGDMIHVSDLFTTFARVAQASDYIPRDRVIDGLDQTALLLEGENNGRRDYHYIYENEVLRSVVKQEFKMHLPAPGVPGALAPVFNLLRDPREEHAHLGSALWSGASFQDMVKRHMMMIAKYPHAGLARDVPYQGIESLRPETQKAVEVFLSWQSE